ncbi:acyl-CoA thioesterase [Tomitella biformata]|uniref:acyl-CoA thioesterase n=1 Tax=Tomitella biformata TaxID=630403 RepID=UPI0004638DAF|nr:acyl-CoA thioesterase [Tomitella biformata]
MSVYDCEIQLRWGDCDVLGHINNVYYLEYAQEARLRYFGRWADAGIRVGSVVVRRVEVDFERSLLYSAKTINVEVAVTKIGNTSFTMRQRILGLDGVLYATLNSVIVLVDLEAGKAIPLPDGARKLLGENLVAV